ncbi:MAG: sensor histidine kinase [Bacteroidota bacterium]
MNTKTYWHKYKTELFFYFGFLTILGIAFFLQTIYADSFDASASKPETNEIINVFLDRIVAAYLWLLMTPLIIWIAERISTKPLPFFIVLVMHLFIGLFFTFLHIPIYATYIYIVHSIIPWMYGSIFEKLPGITYPEYVVTSLSKVNHVYRLLYYSIIIAIHFAFDYFRKFSERELRASQLEVQLKEAQIRTLHQQLQPHFLFNTLNGISSLMYKSVDEADKMLTYLGDLLRISLERMNLQEVPLKDDIAFIERYLLIEKIRMGDRLQVRTNFQPDTLDALVPCMMLQPILENAIKHGIVPMSKQGTIIATSWREAEKLFLQIEDDGKGFSTPLESNLPKGYGIKNTLERLSILYGKNHTITFSNKESGGLRVTLSIPFRMLTD